MLGSVLHGEEYVDIVLDVSGQPSSFIDDYGQQLTAAGWQESSVRGGLGGGFVPTEEVSYALFCKGSSGPDLSVSAFDIGNGIAEVRLNINIDTKSVGGSCEERYGAQLERAGWKRGDEVGSDAVAWNTWPFSNEGQQWWGVFLAINPTEKGETRTVYLRVERLDSGGLNRSSDFREESITVQH